MSPITDFFAARLDEREAAAARTLREVEADRRLLLRWRKLDSCRGDNAEDEARAWLLDSIITDRAAIWSDHPDYQEQWKR